MVTVNGDYNQRQTDQASSQAHQEQQKARPEQNNFHQNRQQGQNFAKDNPTKPKSNTLKYGAIGAVITAVLFLCKRKFFALIAAAATGAYFYFNHSSTAAKPQASQQQSRPDIHQEQPVNQPSVQDSLNLERMKQYINDSKIETTSKSFLNQVIESTRSKLNSTNQLNKVIIHQAMQESGFQQNADALRKDISKLMHPDRIKQSDLNDLGELTMMVFQAAQDLAAAQG